MSRPRNTRWRVALLAAGLIGGMAASPARALEWSGSLKSIGLRSRASTGEPYLLNLNRLRIEAKGDLMPGVAVDLQYDNEVLLGSYLDSTDFHAQKDVPPAQYWRADANYVERGDVYGRHWVHRGALTLSRGDIDLRLGRQRIAWGTGRFWSPLDILNPVNPLALEREERVGVDAALLEAKLGPLARASFVYAPSPLRGSANRALQWHGNMAGVDGSIVAGHLAGLKILGTDIASQIGNAGVRAEAARLTPQAGPGFSRWMVGADYAFANGLTLSAELYGNGAGSRDLASYDWVGLRAGRITSLATRYAGLYASYDITPLLKWSTYVAVNVDDRSRGLDTRLVWSWRADVELTVGLRSFGGGPRSEYGRMPGAALAQAQWFF